jgi:UDP-N-acetylmuramate: L-alanyl-gamma-D-glutamyl-meso-diaminopimelate ligase
LPYSDRFQDETNRDKFRQKSHSRQCQKDLGFEISGSDQRVYPPISLFLDQKGISVKQPFSEQNLSGQPDLVIIGNAVTRDNPEARMVAKQKLNYCSMPQAIKHYIAAKKQLIVVTGTHGKTTTSALTAWILYQAGLDPSFIIGGILTDFNSNYRIGKGDHIVLEGDEYDTAFFDKGPKFLHYLPDLAVLTSVEFDHADIFQDLDHVRQAFNGFISNIHHESTLLAFDDDENIAGLINGKNCRVVKYGRHMESPWRLGDISIKPPWTDFEVFYDQKKYQTFQPRLIGEHNLLNALAAIALADTLSIPKALIAKALNNFQGVKRRQEVRGVKRGITVIDDFAHHPTAVKETIRAIKPFCNRGRLIAVFEPRTNSSMRKVFQNIYPLSFDPADLICIRKPPLLEKIPTPERFSSETLVADLNRRGLAAHYFPDTDTIIAFLIAEAQTGDVILIMSNGGFDNIHDRVLKRL